MVYFRADLRRQGYFLAVLHAYSGVPNSQTRLTIHAVENWQVFYDLLQ